MNGRQRPGRQIENLFGFGADHLAHALGFLLGDTGKRHQVTLDIFHRLGERGADVACLRRQFLGGAQQSFAFGHRFADQILGVRADAMAGHALVEDFGTLLGVSVLRRCDTYRSDNSASD